MTDPDGPTGTSEVTPTSTGTESSTGESDCELEVECQTNEFCIDGIDTTGGALGNCVCLPGWVLCGEECVDIQTDLDHCGRCNESCLTRCSSGVCGEILPPGESFGPSAIIAGVEGGSECTFYSEAKPERSVNHFSDGIQYFSAAQRTTFVGDKGWYNWTDLSSAWDSGTKQTPKDDLSYAIGNDPWSATHGGTGLEYVIAFGNRPMEARCVMVAATDASSMAAGIWTYPFECANTPGMDVFSLPDGPVIVSDLGDDALYIAYHYIDLGSHLIVQRYSPCAGVPRPDDSEGCPLQWEAEISVNQVQEHANVVINPCTHHPLVLYRDRQLGVGIPMDDVWVTALNTMTGDVIVSTQIDEVPFEANSKCGPSGGCPGDEEVCKCGGADTSTCSANGEGCMDLAARVHGVAYVAPNGQCMLATAYDYSAVASDNETYMKSKTKIFLLEGDVPTEIQEVKSSMDSVAQNEFNGTVLVDQFTGRSGFFFYRQDEGNPCDTYYIGKVSPDGLAIDEVRLSSSFPTIQFSGITGMGHFVEGGRFTEPGVLFPSWSQPIRTTETCQECVFNDFSLAVLGSRVSP